MYRCTCYPFDSEYPSKFRAKSRFFQLFLLFNVAILLLHFRIFDILGIHYFPLEKAADLKLVNLNLNQPKRSILRYLNEIIEIDTNIGARSGQKFWNAISPTSVKNCLIKSQCTLDSISKSWNLCLLINEIPLVTSLLNNRIQ